MALSLVSANLAWQEVIKGLANANPAIQGQFKALKSYLASQKRNPDLQYIPFNEAVIVQPTGYSPIGGVTSTVYGVYFIKNGTSGAGTGTDSWLTLANDASNATDATKFVALKLDKA